MGLTSALTTALTGLNAAETQIDVIGNNLANSQTVGFKSSDVIFGTQFLQTLSLGAGPSQNSGGINPRQIGLGVQVAEIAANHNRGTIEISSSSSDFSLLRAETANVFIPATVFSSSTAMRNSSVSLDSVCWVTV